VAVVMTMGALHDGHTALLVPPDNRRPRHRHRLRQPAAVRAGRGPRPVSPTLDADLDRCAAERVDLVFAPTAAEMYPEGEPRIGIRAGQLGELWEGAARPGTSTGCLTVVAKLLHLTAPDLALFGQKDASSWFSSGGWSTTWTRLHRGRVPTVRDPDGWHSAAGTDT
jgi:pantoate--beta-alanine ligase